MTLFRSKKPEPMTVYTDVSEGLKQIYKTQLLPIEKEFLYNDIMSPDLEDPDFEAKPLVMIVGQYSTGKTSFIRYLIEKDYPGMMIGPEPTTDKFVIIAHNKEEGKIPGHLLAVDKKKPYRRLQEFGGGFLSRFESSETDSDVLKSITIVDTPGILAGEKQSISRGYDFTEVLRWFGERADRIILLFDAHKLDISDEFKSAIEAIKNQEDKIRIILNKADMMTSQQLMRVYGALMWSLSKILHSPEVARVYVGSFWDKALQFEGNRDLFEAEQEDLIRDLQNLPRNATIRKTNDLIKRTRSVRVHALLINYIRKQMPSIGRTSKKKEILKNLDKYLEALQAEYHLAKTDLPDVQALKIQLERHDFSKFPVIKKDTLNILENVLSEEITRVIQLLPQEAQANVVSRQVQGGVFNKPLLPVGVGIMAGEGEKGWIVARERSSFDQVFQTLEQNNGKITAAIAKKELVKSKLPGQVLAKIWRLADVDRDGCLDIDEFALANYLIRLKLDGVEIPSELPAHLNPPPKETKLNDE